MEKVVFYGDLLDWKEILSYLSLHHYLYQENNCEVVLPVKDAKALE